ncbi:MAG: hypothetical protein FJ295_01140 [Planctomycetes bacterium]|nr:hypothetical protein [Planctomycetota bacterium]
MRILTLLQFLFGNERAIVATAECRQAVWLGMLMAIRPILMNDSPGIRLDCDQTQQRTIADIERNSVKKQYGAGRIVVYARDRQGLPGMQGRCDSAVGLRCDSARKFCWGGPCCYRDSDL